MLLSDHEFEGASEGDGSSSSEDLLDPTDNEEDSVNISATSSISANTSKTRRRDVTGSDGRFDISKIKNWKLPKINKLNESGSNVSRDSRISDRTRRQQHRNTLPSVETDSMVPKAQSTPHADKSGTGTPRPSGQSHSMQSQRAREKAGVSKIG